MRNAGPMQPPPVYSLIGQRQKLELTSAQVNALDSIGNQLSRESSPLSARLREIYGDPGARRRGPTEAGDSLVIQLRRNNQRAVQSVQALLSERQRTLVCEVFRETPEELRERRAAMRERERQRRTGRGMDMEMMDLNRSVWPWCTQAAAPARTP